MLNIHQQTLILKNCNLCSLVEDERAQKVPSATLLLADSKTKIRIIVVSYKEYYCTVFMRTRFSGSMHIFMLSIVNVKLVYPFNVFQMGNG